MVGAMLRNMAEIGESLIRDNVALRQRCRGYEGNFGLDRLDWTLEIRTEKTAHALFAFFARLRTGPAKNRFPGCENFVLAVAYHFCLALSE